LIGIIFSIIAGAAMSFQGVINTALGDKLGLWEANSFVQGTAFLLSVIVTFIFGKGSFKEITSIDKVYLIGGLLGIVITVTVMLGIKNLSPTVSISIILISQLLVAALIDALGILGAEKIAFDFTKYIGIALMIAGVIVFKLKA
jgi:transporter family-2 protein